MTTIAIPLSDECVAQLRLRVARRTDLRDRLGIAISTATPL